MSSQMESRISVAPGLFIAGLWLLVGFIGASVVAAVLPDLMDAEPSSLTAFALLVSGAALAVLAWRRGLGMLEPLERANELRSNADIAVSREMAEPRGQS
jgi:hypothetical protein